MCFSFLAREFQVLRWRRDRSGREDFYILSESRAVPNYGARSNPTGVSYLNVFLYCCKWFNDNVVTNLGLGMYVCLRESTHESFRTMLAVMVPSQTSVLPT